MATRIKGISIKINGDTTGLSKALSKVNSNIKNTQSQLKDVEKLLKLDPTNTELLSQKQKLLAQNIDSTSEKLETLKTANEQAAKSAGNYDAWKEKYDPIKSEINKTQEKLKSLKEQAKQADEQLAKGEISQEKYDSLQNEIKSTSDELKALKQSAKDVSKEFGNPISPEQYDALQREIIETQNELKNLQNEAENSKTALDKIGEAGEKMQKVGDKISGVGSSLMPVTAAIAGVSVAGTKSFADVDKTMQLANKTMGNTSEQAEMLNTAMKDAASNSIFGMSDAANATLNFARAGLKAEEAAATLAPAMNLAAGEGGDLDTVSTGLVATMNSFHEPFENAGAYADIFAAACNNSALDVNSLSGAMSVAAPIFSAAGYSVQDATLAMGLMGNAGIEAEVSANSLKTGLARLVTPTNEGALALSNMGFRAGEAGEQEAKLIKAQNTLEERTAQLTAKQLKYNEALAKHGEGSSQVASAQAALIKAENNLEEAQTVVNFLTQEAAEGTSAYGALMVDEEGNMRPFEAVLKDLQGAFSGLSEQEQIAAASAIFGKTQMTPWLALLNTAPEDVDDLSASIHSCSDLTQEMANTMMGGFGGSIEKLKSSIDVLIYSIGESLAPILQKVIDLVQELINRFNALSPEMKETIAKIALIVAAIAPALVIIGKVISAVGTILTIIPKVVNAIKLVNTAIAGSFLTNPIFLVVAAITALVASFIYLWNKCEGFRQFWIDLWKEIQNTLHSFKDSFSNLWNGFIDSIILGWETIANAFSSTWESIKNFFSTAWNNFQENFQTGMDAIKDTFTSIWTTIYDFFANIFNAIYTTVSTTITTIHDTVVTAWTAVYETIKPLLDAFAYLFETIFQAIQILIGRAMDWVSQKISAIWNAIVAFITPILESVKNTFETIWNNIVSTINTVLETIHNIIMTVWNAIVAFITPILENIKNIFGIIWNSIANTISMVLDGIWNTISSVWNAIKTTVTNVMVSIKNTVSNIWNAIKTKITDTMNIIKINVSNIWDNIKLAISEKITGIKNTIVDGFNNAANFVKNLANEAWTWGADIINNIVTGIKDRINSVAEAVTSVADTIREFLHFSVPDKGPLTDFESWMPDFMKGLAGGIRKNQKYVEKAVNSVAEAMQLTMDNDINYTLHGVSDVMTAGTSAGVVNNYYNTDNSQTFNQTNNSPKSLSRYDIYRQTNNILGRIKKV